MNKLIKVAEELYKQIEELQHKLTSSLNNDDYETLIKEECFISNIIDRKDNIVDLSEVWKDSNHIPQADKKVVVVNDNGRFISGYLFIDKYTFTVEVNSFYTETSDIGNLYRWAYIDDLLPKGGEQWNTTK